MFCDWTLELAKPVLQGADSPAKDETRATIAFIFDEICKLLHPFMPFLTEELWAIKGEEGPKRETILALAPWPELDASDRCRGRGRDRLGGRPRQRDPLRPLGDQRAGRRADPARAGRVRPPTCRTRAGALGRHREAPRAHLGDRLRRRGAEELDPAHRSAARSRPFRWKASIDLDAERARLAKEIQKLDADVAKIDAKLGNADFLKRAPEEVVDEQRERREEAVARKAKMEEALARLKDA